MAGEGRRDEEAKSGDPEIAHAEWLFRDDPSGSKADGSAPPPAAPGETFELADGPAVEPEIDAAPVPPLNPPRDRPAPRPRESGRERSTRAGEAYPIDAEPAVDEVWSRGAEWGANLLLIGAWLIGLLTVIYFLVGWELYLLAALVLLIGGVCAALLSYPILITLERPVRITPEQAVKDFYGALSHHVPHYRRMWLLLSRAGRLCSSYGSFEGFKAYWKERLQTMKGSQAGALTPLVFEVEDYRGDKSSGKERVEAKFTLKVSIRGRRQDGPIASIPGVVSLVRGPDRMWYLDSGTLPHARRDSPPRG